MGRKSRGRQKPSKPIPFNGDHGTGTQAAMAGTVLEPLVDERGGNPNNLGQRRRMDVIEALGLDMRQKQAATAIRDAHCRVEMLSSGGELKEQVDASPKPDAAVAAQVDALSNRSRYMAAVPRDFRKVVEHVCWNNQPISKLPGSRNSHSACFKVAMDLVANKCDREGW